MDVGTVKIAEDSDFETLKRLVDDTANWKLEYDKEETAKVWTRGSSGSSIKMVKIHATYNDISAGTLFDVLHDPEYRKQWDSHMLASIEIGYLNPNNDVGYYAISSPTPLKNRDFVLQRSWLDLGDEKLIFNHSIHHKSYPPKKGFIRATSFITGFVIRKSGKGCFIGYVSQCDPKGKLPPWLVNKVTQIFAPKLVKQLYKAAKGYDSWKINSECADFKPWIYPEQTIHSPRISVQDCVPVTTATGKKGSRQSLNMESDDE